MPVATATGYRVYRWSGTTWVLVVAVATTKATVALPLTGRRLWTVSATFADGTESLSLNAGVWGMR